MAGAHQSKTRSGNTFSLRAMILEGGSVIIRRASVLVPLRHPARLLDRWTKTTLNLSNHLYKLFNRHTDKHPPTDTHEDHSATRLRRLDATFSSFCFNTCRMHYLDKLVRPASRDEATPTRTGVVFVHEDLHFGPRCARHRRRSWD